MMRVAMRYWGVLLLFCLAEPLHMSGQAGAMPVDALQQGLQGKLVSLRTPLNGEKLVFNADGEAVGKTEHGVVSLDRDIMIKEVSAKDGNLVLKGERVNYIWSSKLKQLAQTPKRAPVEVQIVPSQAVSGDDIGAVLRRVFLTPKEMNAPCTAEEEEDFKKWLEGGDIPRKKKKKPDPNDSGGTEATNNLSVCLPTRERGYRVAKGLKPPTAIQTPDPSYGETPRKNKVQGTAIYAVRVDEKGLVSDVLLWRPLDPVLNLNGARAISQWQFLPGTLEGKPVPTIIKVEVNFRLY